MVAEPTARHSRGPQVADAVLEATIALLTERAYSFSVEDVARRAGVHKTTVYRRYSTKAALVGAAIDRVALAPSRVDESGDVLEDLAELAGAAARFLNSAAGARLARAVVAATSEDPEILTVARRFFAGRFDTVGPIVSRAVASGQVRAGTDPLLLWGAIVNPLHMRALLGHPVSESTARDLVVQALNGVATTPP